MEEFENKNVLKIKKEFTVANYSILLRERRKVVPRNLQVSLVESWPSKLGENNNWAFVKSKVWFCGMDKSVEFDWQLFAV